MLNKFNDESRQFSPSGIWWSSFFAALSVLLPSAPFMQGMTVVRPLVVAGILFFCAILIFFFFFLRQEKKLRINSGVCQQIIW